MCCASKCMDEVSECVYVSESCVCVVRTKCMDEVAEEENDCQLD